MRIGGLLLLLVSGTLLLPATGRAQDETTASTDDEEARGLFDAGERAFSSGNYDRALEHFERAYALSHRDALLYNIAVTADRLRLDARALEAFEAYLASPELEPELRVQVEARIAVLRRTSPDDETAPPAPDTTGAIVVMVIGGALAAGSAIFFGLGAAENDAVQNAPPGSAWADYSGRLDAANGLVVAGGAAAGLGLGLLAAGGLVLGASGGAPREHAIRVVPGWGTLRVEGRF